jgi:hypothetical protein
MKASIKPSSLTAISLLAESVTDIIKGKNLTATFVPLELSSNEMSG